MYILFIIKAQPCISSGMSPHGLSTVDTDEKCFSALSKSFERTWSSLIMEGIEC